MSTRVKILNKLFLFIGIFLCSFLSAFAAENSLFGIDVKQLNEADYSVILKVDNSLDVQKVFNGEDNLTLVLNQTVPTDSVEIIYDNAADLENVIVQKKNNGDTAILLQGKGIENAKIFTKDLASGQLVQADNKKLFSVDIKTAGFSVLGFIAFFMLMLSIRPKNKRYNSNVKNVKATKKVVANTLRNKIQHQSKNIPSINYNVNAGFKSNMSVPKDFVINNYMEEEIRKVG